MLLCRLNEGSVVPSGERDRTPTGGWLDEIRRSVAVPMSSAVTSPLSGTAPSAVAISAAFEQQSCIDGEAQR